MELGAVLCGGRESMQRSGGLLCTLVKAATPAPSVWLWGIFFRVLGVLHRDMEHLGGHSDGWSVVVL